MDERAGDVEREESQRPQDEDDDRESEEHEAILRLFASETVGTRLLFLRLSDQPAVFQRRSDETREERMRLERAALELRVKLDADKPPMVGTLDDFGEFAVGRHAGKDQARSFELVAIMDVD